MEEFSWTDDSALFQVIFGESGSRRFLSAEEYIRNRLSCPAISRGMKIRIIPDKGEPRDVIVTHVESHIITTMEL